MDPRTLTRVACWFLVALFLAPGLVVADDDAPLTVRIGGEDLDQPKLQALETQVRAEITKLEETPAPDAEVRKARLDVMNAQAAALAGAAQQIERIQKAPGVATSLRTEIEAARTELAKSEKKAIPEPGIDPELDNAGLEALEGASKVAEQQQADTEGIATQAADTLKKLQEDVDGVASRVVELDARKAEIAATLEKTPEDKTAERDLLARRIQTNEVRRGVVGLLGAHGGVLLENDRLRRELAQLVAQNAVVQRTIADARRDKARTVYEAALAEKAKRDQEAAARKLKEAELDGTPAGAAIARLEALVLAMKTDITDDRRRTSELKRFVDQSNEFARTAATRLTSLKLLYPADASLEPWQWEGVAQQQRELDRDRAEFDAFRRESAPDLNAALASILTKRQRRQMFQHRLNTAKDRIESGSDERDQVAAIQRELKYSRDTEYQEWLTARLDFLKGQAGLNREDADILRGDWKKETSALRELVGVCSQELEQHKASVEALIQSEAATDRALRDRRKHLDRIAFWLRGPSLFAASSFEAAGNEARHLAQSATEIPEHVGSLRPTSGFRLLLALLLTLAAFVGGLWIRRRTAQPTSDADPTVRAAWWRVARHMVLPVALLGVALYVGYEVVPDNWVGVIFVALAVGWLAFDLSRVVIREFFTADEQGRFVAGCSAETAERARLVMRLLFKGFGIFFPLVRMLSLADAPQLARFAGFGWGVLGVGVGAMLAFRHDVLHLIIPKRGGGSVVSRAMSSTLRFLWPAMVLSSAGVLLLFALGYNRASAHFASRGALLIAALGAIAVVYGMLRAIVASRRHEPADGVDDPSRDEPDFHLVTRLLNGVLTLGALVAIWALVSAIFGMRSEDWADIFGWSLTGSGVGEGITVGKLFRAVVIVVAGIAVANYVRDVVRSVLRNSGLHKGSRYAIRTLLYYSMAILILFGALGALGLETSQLGWFLTAAGLGIGFGLQEIISNFISGLILFFERPVQVGDIITVGDVEGDVTRISIRATVVRTRDGVSIILPNKKLVTEDVVNWSHGNLNTRLNTNVGVAYGSDVKLVREILLQAAKEQSRVLRRPAPDVDFVAFGESELQFVLRTWLATPDTSARRQTRSAINTRINELFAEAGVTIPFPQRDLHLKSSDIGPLSREQDNPDASTFESPSPGFES